ncbi:DUF1634 domain-containing protein [Flavobacterium sp. DG1-102-2]|uniref:DUF1634 domain-containing protein n=1 Tax=Flavobacterium sp. DG1-102-2 TaxID=3081663 RepID=UPI00294A43FF|nr:DUF1634 domain-containing protein [Flavobacterium sp. DG1-102-2]MDV6167358.1 DUF1634 domain-containing protein [Flavobacterium sp. DG1-102-2]
MERQVYNDKNFQLIIGNLLRYGVWISLAFAALGGVIYLIHHGGELENYSNFVEKDSNLFVVIDSVIEGAIQGRGESVIFFGVILLFLTPVLRILLSLMSFILEKDYLYTVITLVVILIIIISIGFGFSH